MKNNGPKSSTPATLLTPGPTGLPGRTVITSGMPHGHPGRALAEVPSVPDQYVLRLFIAGATARSQAAVRRVRALCAEELLGRSTLEVIDIYQQPALARAHQIVATPTLIIALPLPVRRFIGSLTPISDLLGLFDLGERGRIVL